MLQMMRNDRVAFWDTMQVLLPPAAGLLPLFLVWLAGGFDRFVWIGQDASPMEGFGILAAICWPLAAYFYVRGESDTILGRESLGWPTVHGRLSEWQVRPFVTAYLGRLNKVVARYSYELDGEQYDGDLMAFGPGSVRNGAALERVKAKYRPGMEVTLHHAPDQPALAVLEPGDAFAGDRQPSIRLLLLAPMVYPVVAVLFSI